MNNPNEWWYPGSKREKEYWERKNKYKLIDTGALIKYLTTGKIDDKWLREPPQTGDK